MQPHRHSQKQKRHTLATHASRQEIDAALRFTPKSIAEEQGQGSKQKTIESLAQQVYWWSIHDLDYRPERDNAKIRGHGRSLLLSLQQQQEQGFCSQALESLCESPCAPMFEYLVENIKPRSIVQAKQPCQVQSMKQATDQIVANLTERQLRALQVRELVHAIAHKQQEIKNLKKQIKRQRQTQSVKEIHYQQSSQKVRVLEEFDTLFHELVPKVARNTSLLKSHTSHPHKVEVIFKIMLEGISQIVKLATVDDITIKQITLPGGWGVEELYKQIQQTNDSTNSFLNIVKSMKENILMSSDASQQDLITRAQNRDDSSEASDLLLIFRDHHLERVVQIELALNKISAFKQEIDQLYSRMRFQAQRPDHDKTLAPFIQELEEARAHLKGLGTALEFIQAEQENLVDRVVPKVEQRAKLESMNKAARAVDQRMVKAQKIIRKLMEMIRIKHESVPEKAYTISEDIQSIFQEFVELSELLQSQAYTLKGDAEGLQALTEQSQRLYEVTHQRTLQQPASKAGVLEMIPSFWYETATASSLAAEQLILRQAHCHIENAVRQQAIIKARDANNRMEQTKANALVMLKSFTKKLPDEYMSQTQNDDKMVMKLNSSFEKEITSAIQSVVKYQDSCYTAIQDDIQKILLNTAIGNNAVEEIQGLIKDDSNLHERLSALRPQSSNKRTRQAQ
ncbi:hypothetical protein BX616_004630 [Lobosporangium transversale]|uniref:Uncharacterized protein n=1 Tax=Lobosporangium transversale TaxID=64571 RepID=A0A1Y2G6L4_9FUNG|nr:hypothetical protein BCR41DRAFT_364218 [Lobosporangium transversale]KAF9916097.1 hypothetical protein BX616_004630 [Lobosporangium transversale]ORY98368.1 hypothetical protein BCR41DRAFT_364218 [Lobosporangium transversale]|eukprot:XP_021875760.1 hypothetical protein BCR41DRAFT_364218 [Lobosporangium transversale]